jgi:N-acetylated-alpha-linked acidic dipeptidase
MNLALLLALGTQLSTVEARFMESVSPEQIAAIHRLATRRPHIAGSAASLDLADQLRRELVKAGLEVEVADFRVWLSTPRRISVEITAPVREPLAVDEPASALDPDSAHRELGPAFVAYSASGRVTAPIVDVGYGLPPDYERLAKSGVDVRGRIALARYGRSHRAVKVFTAEQHGAVGIIIYSDPADDGAGRGATWPDGPWRAAFQAQRGNAKYSWHWHGDPLTPGVGATRDAKRLDPATAPTLPRIPAVVLSWAAAEKIRKQASPTVRLDVQMDAGLRPIRNVIGRIRGRDSSRAVMLGTHHDAWTFGGMDPGSGLSAVFEVARTLAALRRSGWVPERDIVFAFWDAEEFGLVGSTEYAEAFQQQLRQQLVTYINTDLFMRGRFDGGGTPSLRDFLVQVTKDVPMYSGQGSVYDHWRGTRTTEVELAALGSGADFVAFQDFLGLPTLQMEFDFEGSYGTYHSNYDTRWFVERFSDPGFAVARTVTQVLGLAAMRLASADVLPFRYSHYATLIEQFAAEFDAPRAIAGEIRRLALALEERIRQRLAASDLAETTRKALNDRLVRLEQTLLDESEPSDKRWYRHVVYGWNIYSLYDGQPLPGVAYAQRAGDAARVSDEVQRLTAALTRMRNALDAALAELK